MRWLAGCTSGRRPPRAPRRALVRALCFRDHLPNQLARFRAEPAGIAAASRAGIATVATSHGEAAGGGFDHSRAGSCRVSIAAGNGVPCASAHLIRQLGIVSETVH